MFKYNIRLSTYEARIPVSAVINEVVHLSANRHDFAYSYALVCFCVYVFVCVYLFMCVCYFRPHRS